MGEWLKGCLFKFVIVQSVDSSHCSCRGCNMFFGVIFSVFPKLISFALILPYVTSAVCSMISPNSILKSCLKYFLFFVLIVV